MSKTTNGVKRRDVLKGATAVAGLGVVSAVTGFPYYARAQGSTIRIGMPTILSGRVAILGTSSRYAAQIAVEEFNAAGGVNGKKIELVDRDSKGSPDEAAKVARDLINSDGCEILIDAEASSGSFAVQEVVRELPVLCVHTCSETSSLTADPKIRSETAFRCARQGVHDAIGGGRDPAGRNEGKGITKWMTCSPDYAYGRDNTSEFVDYLKIFAPNVEIVDQAWPKLFEPDYTAFVTRILQVKPQAMYSALWGGDLVAFIEQGNLYGLFSGDMLYFSGGLADPPVLGAIKQVPENLNSVYRYDANFPDNPRNKEFDEKYFKLANQHPTNWSWQNHAAFSFVFEALRRTNGNTDGKALAAEMKGLQIDTPFSATGKMTMREDDHTVIDYPVAWGKSVASPPSFKDWVSADWGEIQEREAEWKKLKGYA